MDEGSAVLCPKRPFRQLSACLREEGHDGRCVFAKGTPGGRHREEGSSALTFYEQAARGRSFRALAHADLQPGARPTRREAAALWAFVEMRAQPDQGATP